MDDGEKNFSGLADEAMPPELHRKIMNRVLARYYGRLVFPFCLLFVANAALSGWRVWTKLAEADFFSILSALHESFEWSFVFLSDSAVTIFSVLPLYALTAFCINMIIVLYLIKVGNVFTQSYKNI